MGRRERPQHHLWQSRRARRSRSCRRCRFLTELSQETCALYLRGVAPKAERLVSGTWPCDDECASLPISYHHLELIELKAGYAIIIGESWRHCRWGEKKKNKIRH